MEERGMHRYSLIGWIAILILIIALILYFFVLPSADKLSEKDPALEKTKDLWITVMSWAITIFVILVLLFYIIEYFRLRRQVSSIREEYPHFQKGI